MSSASTIGINDDFTACKTCVSVRSTNHKLSSWIHMQDELVVKEHLNFLGQFLHNTWQQDCFHVMLDAVHHLLVGLFLANAIGLDELIVLSTYYYSVDANRLVGLVIILNRHLTLSIRTKIRDNTTLAQGSEFAQQHVCKVKRERHIVKSLVAGITKHHALIAGSLVLLAFAVHTTVDVATLLMYCREHTARVAIKLVLALSITYLIYDTTSHLHQVDVGLTLYLTCNYHLTSGNESFTCHATVGIKSQKMIEKRIANLVSNFVGMSFRHRLTSK